MQVLKASTAARPAAGLAEELAKITLDVAHGELSTATLGDIARLALHAFGVGIAGAALPVARIARAAIGSPPGPCTVFGSATSTGCDDAAFANAVAGHASLLEDSGPGGAAEGSHPGTYVFPTALAVAEQEDASGLAFMRALCAGYEAVSRLATVMPADAFRRGFRAVPVLGPFGAAAATASLLRLTPVQLGQAFGIAANLAGGTNQGFVDGTMEPYLHPAFAARNGILAARFAAAGGTASWRSLDGPLGFFAAFGGAAVAARELNLGREPAVSRVGVKRFATCLYNQGTLGLLCEHFALGLPAASIGRVVLRRPATGIDGLHAAGVNAPPPYITGLQRQMSARCTAAAALLGRPVETAGCYERPDEEMESLARRIELVTTDEAGVRIEIELAAGTAGSSKTRVLCSDGRPVLGFSLDATRIQFEQRVRPLIGSRTEALLNLILDLPGLDRISRIGSLMRAEA